MRISLGVLAAAGLLLASGTALAAPPMDNAGFTQYVISRLTPFVPDRGELVSRGPLDVTLKERNGTASVSLDLVHDACAKVPDSCETRIDQFVQQWAHNFGNPPIPDRMKIHAEISLGTLVSFLQRGRVGENPVAAPYLGHLWVACMNENHFLKEDDLAPLGLSTDQAIALCERNTISAQPAFADDLLDLPKGGIGKLNGEGEASLVLTHDLWEPVAARFGGELIVCVTGERTLYYGHGADDASVAAMEQRAKRDTAETMSDAMADHRKFDPDSVSFDVLRWTPTGWDIVARS
jgi:hypothetical protein